MLRVQRPHPGAVCNTLRHPLPAFQIQAAPFTWQTQGGRMNELTKLVLVTCDPEGNGPGALAIEGDVFGGLPV